MVDGDQYETYNYPHEKLSRTVDGLASGVGHISERLTSVYNDQGHRIPVVDGGDEEPDLAARIEKFHAEMAEALPGLTDPRAHELVETILDIHGRVAELYWTGRGAR